MATSAALGSIRPEIHTAHQAGSALDCYKMASQAASHTLSWYPYFVINLFVWPISTNNSPTGIYTVPPVPKQAPSLVFLYHYTPVFVLEKKDCGSHAVDQF